MDSSNPTVWPLPFAETPVLELSAGAVALEIVPVPPGGQARVESTGGRHSDRMPPKIVLEEGVVRLEFEPLGLAWPPWRRGHHGSFRLVVPSNLRARVRCAAGQLRVTDLAGCDLELTTGAGQISLSDVHGRLALEASAGQIRGERIGGTLQVDSSLGEVRLEIDALDPGTHRIHSSMGSVRLALVEGLKVRIDARTMMGSTRNRYPSTPDADTILSLETDLGSVRIDPGASAGETSWEDWRPRWGGQPWRNSCWGDAERARDIRAPFAFHHGRPGWHGGGPFEVDSRRPSSSSPPFEASHDELKRILTLIEQGKINAEQADELIRALQGR